MPFIHDTPAIPADLPSADTNVCPGNITGPTDYKLATLDQFAGRRYDTCVWAFRINSNKSNWEIFQDMQTGLATSLKPAPQLAGRMTWDDTKRSTVKVAMDETTGLPFNFRDYSGLDEKQWPFGTFDDLERENFPLERMPRDYFRHPLIHVGDPNKKAPVAIAQANFIKGGMVMSLDVYHSVQDAHARDPWVRVWAENTARAAAGEAQQVPEWPAEWSDRTMFSEGPKGIPQKQLLAKMREGKGGEKKDGEEKPQGNYQNRSLESSSDGTVIEEALWQVSEENVKKLKTEAWPTEEGSYVSTNDALVALLWIHTTKIRAQRDPNLTSSKMAIAMSLRGRMPGVPKTYMGNALHRLYAEAPVAELTKDSPDTLRYAAGRIRDAVNGVEFKKIPIQIAVGNNIPSFTGLAKHEYIPNTTVLASTNRSKVNCYKLDWGMDLGHVQRWRLYDPQENSRTIILPKTAQGYFEVFTGLETSTLEALRNSPEFTKYFEFCFQEKLPKGHSGRDWKPE